MRKWKAVFHHGHWMVGKTNFYGHVIELYDNSLYESEERAAIFAEQKNLGY